MGYKEWTMEIKHLTELLMSYVSVTEKDDANEKESLADEINLIFDKLYSKTTEESKKEEVINLILLKMQEKTLTHLDVATYTRELVMYGFQ